MCMSSATKRGQVAARGIPTMLLKLPGHLGATLRGQVGPESSGAALGHPITRMRPILYTSIVFHNMYLLYVVLYVYVDVGHITLWIGQITLVKALTKTVGAACKVPQCRRFEHDPTSARD